MPILQTKKLRHRQVRAWNCGRSASKALVQAHSVLCCFSSDIYTFPTLRILCTVFNKSLWMDGTHPMLPSSSHPGHYYLLSFVVHSLYFYCRNSISISNNLTVTCVCFSLPLDRR